MSAGPSSITCATASGSPPSSKSGGPPAREVDPGAAAGSRRGPQLREEDLEQSEADIELALVQEYRAMLPMFTYVVETERRFYLANEVSMEVRSDIAPACIELTLTDAWVWDMYRPARFVPSVRVVSFRDVNVERLPEKEL
jgi:hypothetical protein